jgi:hypothetical protein
MLVSLVMPLTYQRLQNRWLPIVLQLHQRMVLVLVRLLMPPPYYQPHVRLLMPPQGLLNRLPMLHQQDQQLQIRRFPIVLQLHRQLSLMLARLLMPPPYYQPHVRLLMIFSMLCQLISGNRIGYGNHNQFHQDEVKVKESQISRNRKFRPY